MDYFWIGVPGELTVGQNRAVESSGLEDRTVERRTSWLGYGDGERDVDHTFLRIKCEDRDEALSRLAEVLSIPAGELMAVPEGLV